MKFFKKAILPSYASSCSSQFSLSRFVIYFYLIMSLLLFSLPLRAEQGTNEFYIKAAYVRKIIDFIGWPETSFSSEQSSIVLCMIGVDNFPVSFYRLEGTTIGKRPLKIIRFNAKHARQETIKGCHLMYVGQVSHNLSQKLMTIAPEEGIVTLSDRDHFIYERGMIGLVVNNDHINIEVNLDVAEVTGIHISAQLLEVADSIVKDSWEFE